MKAFHDPLFSGFGDIKPRSAEMDADEAIRYLNDGNQQFVDWVARHSKRSPEDSLDFESLTGIADPSTVATQAPIGIVVGCSDARFPLRLALGQKISNLFEIRVAGNVLAEECLGSVEFALHQLKTVKVLAVIGHSHCGAVTAAADAYLNPTELLPSKISSGLRSIVHRLLGPVLQAADTLKRFQSVNGDHDDARKRTHLIETAVHLNAAIVANELQLAVERCRRPDVAVVYGVFDLRDYVVRSARTNNGLWSVDSGLSAAPQLPGEVVSIAEAASTALMEKIPSP